MKTKKAPLLLSLFLLLVCSPLFSQKVDISFSSEFSESGNFFPPDILGFDGTHYYLYQDGTRMKPGTTDKEKGYISKLDRDLKQVQRVEIGFITDRIRERLDFVVFMDQQLYLFSSVTPIHGNTVELFVRKIDSETLSVPERGTSVTKVKSPGVTKNNPTRFGYTQSPDGSKLLIHYRLPFQPKLSPRFGILTFSDEMLPLWEQAYELPYDSRLFFFGRFQVDNEAKGYLLVRNSLGNKPPKGEPDYEYLLLIATPGQEQVKEVPISLEGKFLTYLHIRMTDQQQLVGAGIYAEEEPELQKGVYSFLYDTKQGAFTQQKSEKLAASLLGEKEEGLYNYDFEYMRVQEDGRITLIGEHQVVHNSGETTWYHYGDILTVTLRPDGTVERFAEIEKHQRTTNGNVLVSYQAVEIGDKQYFLYNDFAKNLSLREGKTSKMYVPTRSAKAKQALAMVGLDAAGTQQSQLVFTMDEVGLFPFVRSSIKTQDNEVLVICKQGKNHRFARLTFPE